MSTAMHDVDSTNSAMGVSLALRWAFLDDFLQSNLGDTLPFVEVSPENYMRRGGYYPEALETVRTRHRVLTHGLMMNLGSTSPLDQDYLRELRRFLARVGARHHSDHLCWSGTSGRILHDLLPLPLDERVIDHVAERIRRVQDVIGVPFAVENISYYARMSDGLPEHAFLAEVLERADCGLMLDVNNVYVNSVNHGFDPYAYLASLPLERIVQMHIAGGERMPHLENLVIDTHGTAVPPEVQDLMAWVLKRVGPKPVIYERDHDIPPLDALLKEVRSLQDVFDEAIASPQAHQRSTSSLPSGNLRAQAAIEHDMQRIIIAQQQPLERDFGTQWFIDDRRHDAPREHGAHGEHDEHGAPDAQRAPDASAAFARMLVYRRLVRGSLERTLRDFIPRTVARMGEAPFRRWFDRWIESEPPRSPYLRDVPLEFAEYCRSQWTQATELPLYLADLVMHEVVESEVAAAPVAESPATTRASTAPVAEPEPLTLTAPVAFDPAIRIVDYRHPVHELPPMLHDRTHPPERPTTLLVYRDAENIVRYLELTPLARSFVQRLHEHGDALELAIRHCSNASAGPIDNDVLERLAGLMVDLAKRGIVRGSAPARTPVAS